MGTGGVPADSLVDRPQLTSEFFTVNLVTYCPKLIELDVCGLKNLTANALVQYLDQRLRLVSFILLQYLYYKLCNYYQHFLYILLIRWKQITIIL